MPQGNSGSFEIAVQMLRQLVCLCPSVCLSVSLPVSSQIRFDQREREKSFTDLFALVRTETHIHPSILETSLLDSQEKQRKGRGRKGKQMKWNWHFNCNLCASPKKSKIITKFACNWCQGTSNSKLNHLLYSRAPAMWGLRRAEKGERKCDREREREREGGKSKPTNGGCMWEMLLKCAPRTRCKIFYWNIQTATTNVRRTATTMCRITTTTTATMAATTTAECNA